MKRVCRIRDPGLDERIVESREQQSPIHPAPLLTLPNLIAVLIYVYLALALNVTPNELLRWDDFVRVHRS